MKFIPFTLPVWFYALLLAFAWADAVHFYYFIVLLLAFGNKLFGEFEEKELANTLRYFHTSPTMKRVKLAASIWFLLANISMCWLVATRQPSGWELAVLVASAGLANGSFLLTLAHELSHGPGRSSQIMCNALLTVLCFPFFKADHLFGHHELVGTRADGSTARRGQDLYSFVWQSLRQRVWRSYSTDSDLPAPLKKHLLRYNRHFTAWLVLFGLLLYAISPVLLAFWLGQAAVAIFIYECTNYIQHYGLERQPDEPIGMAHSWNSYRRYAAWYYWMLFVHSPHHSDIPAQRAHPKQGPGLPYPIITMLLLATIPQLWFRLMNPLLDEAKKRANEHNQSPTARKLTSLYSIKSHAA